MGWTKKLLRAGMGGHPHVHAELTELKVESDLGCLLESAALLGCTWACNSRLGEALVYQIEDPPSVGGTAAMWTAPQLKKAAGVSSSLAFCFPARRPPAGRNK